MRRRLSKHEAGIVTEKQKKKQTHFPMRKYAVKVCSLRVLVGILNLGILRQKETGILEMEANTEIL